MQASTRPNLSDEKDLRDLMQDDNFSIDDEQEPMTEGHELRDNEFMVITDLYIIYCANDLTDLSIILSILNFS